jgi:fermentation-respiration switch protein FrsA (DUF1100 family)
MQWTGVWAVIISLFGVYVVLGLVLFMFQSRLVYFPEKLMAATPHDVQLSYEAIYFKTRDGVELFGWYVPAPSGKGTILFCHGNAGNISHRLEVLQIFNRMGLSTFIFDYRGYGLSSGKPTEVGTYLDSDAAWEFLVSRKGIPPDQIVVYGESLGGAVAARLAANHRPGALILASTFTSLPDLGAVLYPLFPVRLLSRFRYSTLEYARRVECPTLVIHSLDDEIVPFRCGRELYNAIAAPKELLSLEGNHNSGFRISGDVYTEGMQGFLSRYLPPSNSSR